jgi:hypothetical protein
MIDFGLKVKILAKNRGLEIPYAFGMYYGELERLTGYNPKNRPRHMKLQTYIEKMGIEKDAETALYRAFNVTKYEKII